MLTDTLIAEFSLQFRCFMVILLLDGLIENGVTLFSWATQPCCGTCAMCVPTMEMFLFFLLYFIARTMGHIAQTISQQHMIALQHYTRYARH